MRLEELTTIKVTPPGIRLRKRNDYWSLARRPELVAAIRKCLRTGEEQYFRSVGDMTLYHIRPEYPLIPKAMERKENRSLLKVSIAIYHAAFHVGVRADSQEQTELLGSGPIPQGLATEPCSREENPELEPSGD